MRILTLVLALIMVASTLSMALTSCGDGTSDPTDPPKGTDTPNAPPSGTDPGTSGKTEYTVSIKTIGGRPIPNLTFHIYKGEDLTAYSQTDANGIGKVSLVPANDYTIELSAASLEGYKIEGRYSFDGNSANIVLTSSVIADSDLTGVNYKVGDIIRDFTVTTTDGSTFNLAETLKTKKAVLINFWYSTCSPCINEFPYMQSAYEEYKNDIEVIALNNYPGDSETAVKEFKANMGLTFPVAKDYSTLGSSFGLTGYPTSILVDRYGTICLIEVGGLTSEKPFIAAFSHFAAADYRQKLFESIDELTPIELPNVEMPSSDEIGAALNGAGFTATYAPETESADAEYSWPFIIGEKNGVKCVYPANSMKDSSFATLHATVTLKKDQALAIDWFADTELSVDILYVLVDGKDIYRISGKSEEWKTCYPFVATQDGTYKVSFVYLKDSGQDEGEDRVYLKNFRTCAIADIDTETYIPRQAATNPNSNGLGFQNYATVVFNEADGYYHVGTVNGPILLANLMDKTLLNETSLNDLGYTGKLTDSQGDMYEILVDYCNYSINGTLYGYCPVTEELKGLLERSAELVGFERNNPNQWLQACTYYDAYGSDGKQLEDPVKGIAFFAAYETELSTDTEDKFNTVTYDGRVIMPRGLKFKFVPTVSGAYVIKSQSSEEVNGWVFNADHDIIYTASIVERPYEGNIIDNTNVNMIVYMEAGETYYIDIAYYDVYAAGTFTFTVKYLAETYEQFHIASPGYFTFVESTGGQMNETIAGGIDVALGGDGYYHELRADGSLGSIVYADFKYPTPIIPSHSIESMISTGAFSFDVNEHYAEVMAKLEELDGDVEACREYYKTLWDAQYDTWAEEYGLEDILSGKALGGGDLTEEISEYLDKMITDTSKPELVGCVAVDEKLASILQMLIDKYSFSGVEHSWTKLCYYYKSIA